MAIFLCKSVVGLYVKLPDVYFCIIKEKMDNEGIQVVEN